MTTTTIDVLLMVKVNKKAASKKEEPRMNFIDEPDAHRLYTVWLKSNHLKEHTT